jgi:hypothetical protein
MSDVSMLFRVVDRNPAHVRVRVWVGRNVGARGKAGELVFRADEWEEIRRTLLNAQGPAVVSVEEIQGAVPA